MSPKVHANARKHFGRDRLSDEAILYAYEHALNSRPLDDEDDPRRWLVVGIDQSGRVLELVMLVFDGGGELLIHAMKVRAQFLDELVCLRVAYPLWPGGWSANSEPSIAGGVGAGS